MKILVFTTDVPPLPGIPTSGTALRTNGIVEGLRSHGHEVIVSAPKQAIEGLKKSIDIASLPEQTRRSLENLEEEAFTSSTQDFVYRNCQPDAIVCGHWPAMQLSVKPSVPLVIDLAGPHLLERHYQAEPGQDDAVLGKLSVLSTADYFIVSGPSQRMYFLSFLLRAGVVNPEKRIVNITMPLPPEGPEHTSFASGEPRFVFGGVFLPWQDPRDALQTLSQKLTARKRGSLLLIGGKHPSYSINEGVYRKLFEELSTNPRVVTKPMLPYEKFLNELESCDVALDVMKWNLERQLAVTIRSTTFLWAGVPIIYNDYADVGKLIKKYDAGWLVSPSDPKALRQIIDEILDTPELVREKSLNARALAKAEFSWDKAVLPLLAFLNGDTQQTPQETDLILDFPSEQSQPIGPDNTVRQTFLGRIPGLRRFDCRVSVSDKNSNEKLHFTLSKIAIDNFASPQSVRDNATKTVVAAQEMNAKDLNDGGWAQFEFPRQADSAGSLYEVSISSDSPAGSVSLWLVEDSPYPYVSLSQGGSLLPRRALCSKSLCTNHSSPVVVTEGEAMAQAIG